MEWIKLRRDNLIIVFISSYFVANILIGFNLDLEIKPLPFYDNLYQSNFLRTLSFLFGINAYLSALFIPLMIMQSFRFDDLLFRNVHILTYPIIKVLFSKISIYFLVFGIINLFLLIVFGIRTHIISSGELYILLFFFLKFLFNSLCYIIQIIAGLIILKYNYKKMFVVFLIILTICMVFIGADYIPINSFINSLAFYSLIHKFSIYEVQEFLKPDFYNLLYTLMLCGLILWKNEKYIPSLATK